MSDRPFCASSPEAAAMSDADFWAHVYPQDGPDDIDPYEGEPGPFTDLLDPCPVCGSVTACGYDAEGLPMIHATEIGDSDA